MNYDLFDSAISSPESASGRSPPASPASTTTRPYGPVPALASLSARQAKAAGSLTSGTSGPPSTISLSNAALRSSLASKLRELTETFGSTLYRLTWTQRVMPSGLRKPSLRASERRTSEPAITGWASPQARDWRDREAPSVVSSGRTDKLPHSVQLASWPTATATDSERRGTLDETNPNVTLNLAAQLASWTTPSATDGERGGTITANMSGTSLTQQANMALAGWTTPQAHDSSPRGAGSREKSKTTGASGGACLAWDAASTITDGPARLTVGGAMLTGCDAGTRSGGQLNPLHSLWLMLGPFATAWASSGERVTRSRSGKRRRSSLPSATPSSSGDV